MEINEYLVKFFQIEKELEDVELFAQKSKLSDTEFRMIREILLEREKGKDIISSELARRLGITRSAVSQIVTKLEKQGIVRRTASDTDRKIAYVRLSDHAIAVFEEQCAYANGIIEEVVAEFGVDKMDELIASCKALSRTFTQVCERRNKERT